MVLIMEFFTREEHYAAKFNNRALAPNGTVHVNAWLKASLAPRLLASKICF